MVPAPQLISIHGSPQKVWSVSWIFFNEFFKDVPKSTKFRCFFDSLSQKYPPLKTKLGTPSTFLTIKFSSFDIWLGLANDGNTTYSPICVPLALCHPRPTLHIQHQSNQDIHSTIITSNLILQITSVTLHCICMMSNTSKWFGLTLWCECQLASDNQCYILLIPFSLFHTISLMSMSYIKSWLSSVDSSHISPHLLKALHNF